PTLGRRLARLSRGTKWLPVARICCNGADGDCLAAGGAILAATATNALELTIGSF
ncbi:MAG: hypothetical protein ACI9SE_000648, partial [Neolewinella sp.]